MKTGTLHMIAGLAVALTSAASIAQPSHNQKESRGAHSLQHTDTSAISKSAGGVLSDLTGVWRVTFTRYDAEERETIDGSEADELDSATDRSSDDAGRRSDRNLESPNQRPGNKSNEANRNSQRDRAASRRLSNSSSSDEARTGTTQISGIAERSWELDGTVLVERYTYSRSNSGRSMSDLPLSGLGRASNRPGNTNRDARPDADGSRQNDSGVRSPLIEDMSENTWQKPREKKDTGSSPLINDMSEKPGDTGNDRDALRRERGNADRSRDADRASRDRGNADAWGNQGRQGLALWSYDAQTEKISVVWADDTGSKIRMDTGSLGADKKIEFDGKVEDKEGTSMTRTVIDLSSPDRQTLVMYKTDAKTGKEHKAFQMVYEKISAGGNAITRAVD